MQEEGSTTYAAYEFNAFSSTTLNNILRQHSKPDFYNLSICILIILTYTGVVLYRFGNPVNGQSGVGMFGVLLLCLSTASGLGVCSLFGIPFNIVTTQVVPLIALGLAVDQVFILTHGYDSRKNSNEQMHTAQILKKYGMSVLFNGSSTVSAFLVAALLPIPVLRSFALQISILITINLVTVLFVFPAFISLDLRRRRSSHLDILCCLPSFTVQSTEVRNPIRESSTKCRNNLKEEGLLQSTTQENKQKCRKFNIHFFIDILLNGKVKVIGVLSIIMVLTSSIYATFKLQDGFELTDLIPRNTSEFNFIDAQSKLFGFYNIFAVTQGNFEYPQNQKLLREYHESFIRIPNIIKNDNGGLPDFWLNQFRDWLIGLQNAFDRDYANGAISKERWYNNASVDGILTFKLLAQTGHVDNPIDKSLITHNRLVDSQGIINPKAFYNYLSAWAWNDAAYAASQSNLRPSPRMWIHSPKDKHMEIPKSAPLTYTQLPFYLHGLYTTKDIKLVIQQIRDLCDKFSMRGLPNYPTGIPFLYWAQFFNLDMLIIISLGISITSTFFLSLIFLQSVPAAILIVINALFCFIQLFGIMLMLNVKLSAIAAIVLISSMGLSICFTANLTLVSNIYFHKKTFFLKLEIDDVMSKRN
jgi:patched 1